MLNIFKFIFFVIFTTTIFAATPIPPAAPTVPTSNTSPKTPATTSTTKTTAPTQPAVAPQPVSGAAERLTNLLQGFKSLQASFTQVSYDTSGKVLQKNTGTMALQRPGKFRWDIKGSSNQLIIADGQYLWVYDKELQQATKKPMSKVKTNNPASLLSGSVASLQQRFTVTSINKKGNGAWFQLKPKAKNDLFQWIQLGFSNNQLSQMRLSDNLGQQSVLKFSNVKTDAALSSNLFQFTPPAGTDVISE